MRFVRRLPRFVRRCPQFVRRPLCEIYSAVPESCSAAVVICSVDAVRLRNKIKSRKGKRERVAHCECKLRKCGLNKREPCNNEVSRATRDAE